LIGRGYCTLKATCCSTLPPSCTAIPRWGIWNVIRNGRSGKGRGQWYRFLRWLLTLLGFAGTARAQSNVREMVNDQGIVTQGQVGSNFIIQHIPASIEIGEALPTLKNQDGSYKLQSIFKLDALSPSRALVVSVRKEDVAPPQGDTLGVLDSFGFSQKGTGTAARAPSDPPMSTIFRRCKLRRQGSILFTRRCRIWKPSHASCLSSNEFS
jgi:hypothetical protein